MIKNNLLVWSCNLCLMAFCLCGAGAVPAPAQARPSIDRRVWTDTADGQTAYFLVILRDQAALPDQPVLTGDRTSRRGDLVDDLRVVAGESQTSVLAELRSLGAQVQPFWIVNSIAVRGGRDAVEALARRVDVLRIEPDPAIKVDLPQANPAADCLSEGTPWGLERIHAPSVWAEGVTGEGIVYASADTGVAWGHPLLVDAYLGWDGESVDHNYNWWDAVQTDIDGNPNNTCGPASPEPCDDYGHGTHTTGTAVGDSVGVAPGAKWIACRNMDQGVGRPSTYIACLQFFLAPTDLKGENPDASRAPDVIGNSYSCPSQEGCDAYSLHEALRVVRAAGIFMAVSAGNKGSACSTISDPPATDGSVFTVGGTAEGDLIYANSSRGPVAVDGSGRLKPDLVAPGVGVCSASLDGGTVTSTGTSMAAPHVAGSVALLWSAWPGLRGQVEQTEGLLRRSADRLTTPETCGTEQAWTSPNNTFGYGLLDVWAAYQELPMALRYYLPWIVR